MTRQNPMALLDVANEIHSVDCAGWGQTAGSSTAPFDEAAFPNEVIAYGLATRRVYSDLRRLVGQVAGLLILAQTSGRRETLDLPARAAIEDQWREIPEHLASVHASGGLGEHLAHLRSSHRLLGASLQAWSEAERKDGKPELVAALANLSAAYRHLQSASEERLGMTMVDFRQSCCNCGCR